MLADTLAGIEGQRQARPSRSRNPQPTGSNEARIKLIARGQDPCIVPKAIKTDAEVIGARAAHVRDGHAIVRFLAWLDDWAADGTLDEITAVQKLEEFRRDTNMLRDVSFPTISGSGPNGAIVHYRVTEATNRRMRPGELFLIDSGGQYPDGTTDITRTIAIGEPTEDMQAAFHRRSEGSYRRRNGALPERHARHRSRSLRPPRALGRSATTSITAPGTASAAISLCTKVRNRFHAPAWRRFSRAC